MLAVSAQESALAAHTHAGSIAPELIFRDPWVRRHELSVITKLTIRTASRLTYYRKMSLLKPGVEPSDTHDLWVRREFREILGAPGCGEKTEGVKSVRFCTKLNTYETAIPNFASPAAG